MSKHITVSLDKGWVRGDVFGGVVSNLEEFAAACQDRWMRGARGETLSFNRR
ncbi:DUF3830 family protein [Kribbella sp. NBC_01484]|uniref:DUF3830 family protein n=1 Tax=Kribbella sp. NBC_01484 TaxID=2903579 RepID=UPI002E354B89|nr:DUF3830 family protein [Kribbella sp. NBC_01484]